MLSVTVIFDHTACYESILGIKQTFVPNLKNFP